MSHPRPREEAQIQYSTARSNAAYNRMVVLGFLGDAVVVWASLLLAYWLRFHTPLVHVGVPDDDSLTIADYFGHFMIGIGIMLALLTNFRLYERPNLISLQQTIRILFKATAVWFVVYLGLSLILKFSPSISRIYALIALGTILVLMPSWRFLLWRILQSEKIAQQLRQRALIVGWSDDFAQAFERFGNSLYRHFDVCGVIRSAANTAMPDLPKGFNHIGRREDLPILLKMRICDVVLVADANPTNSEMMELASTCEKEMIEFKVVPTCFRVLLSGLHLETLAGMPVLGISRLPLHSAVNQYVKRTIDIVGAIVGLILSAPFIAVFGALVYRESPGSIFYRQRRLGASGQHFEILKLRSMRLDAEKAGSPGWTVKDDPRCLRVGKFMRKWNIDELPQFWNVLKGEMSLVGPRPERPELIEDFKEDIPHYNARHHIKPGITGWAQVNGLRGDTDLSERVRFDLHYIENWNVLFDFQIMVMTFFRRENAC